MNDRGPVLIGANAIAKALGCHPETVRRMARDGRLPAFRTGERTSPIRVERKALSEFRRGRDAGSEG